MRVFLGVPVDAHAPLCAATDALDALVPDMRAVPPGSWHLTLRFFGSIPDAAPVVEALDAIAWPREPLKATLGPLGAFSSTQRARIAWVGVAAPGLRALHDEVQEATRALGAPPDVRDFRPHVTLGRARRPVDARIWSARSQAVLGPTGTPCTLDRAVLYASALGPTGPTYEALHTWRWPEP